jgi:hypothetical protein
LPDVACWMACGRSVRALTQVSALPDVQTCKLSPHDRFLILACDGLPLWLRAGNALLRSSYKYSVREPLFL